MLQPLNVNRILTVFEELGSIQTCGQHLLISAAAGGPACFSAKGLGCRYWCLGLPDSGIRVCRLYGGEIRVGSVHGLGLELRDLQVPLGVGIER